MIDMLNCDCMDYMATLPDKAFDLAIVDPPYGININMNMGMRAGQQKTHAVKGWDKDKPSPEYFEELLRISTDAIIWGGNYFQLKPTGAWIYWDKRVPPGISFASGELAWTTFNRALRCAVIPYTGFIGTEGKIHPTQKPVALYKWLLKNYAKPGDRIIDTHGGSGSICIACHDMGFDLTWMELDKDYYEAAVKRYKTHAAQGRLFEPEDIRQPEQVGLFKDGL